LATLINQQKIGDQIELKYWRDGEVKSAKVVLQGKVE